MAGRLIGNGSASSSMVASPSAKRRTIERRVGSDKAAKTTSNRSGAVIDIGVVVSADISQVSYLIGSLHIVKDARNVDAAHRSKVPEPGKCRAARGCPDRADPGRVNCCKHLIAREDSWRPRGWSSSAAWGRRGRPTFGGVRSKWGIPPRCRSGAPLVPLPSGVTCQRRTPQLEGADQLFAVVGLDKERGQRTLLRPSGPGPVGSAGDPGRSTARCRTRRSR